MKYDKTDIIIAGILGFVIGVMLIVLLSARNDIPPPNNTINPNNIINGMFPQVCKLSSGSIRYTGNEWLCIVNNEIILKGGVK
jgi:hypothetical protein